MWIVLIEVFFLFFRVEYKRQSIIVEDSFTHKVLLHNFKGAWTAINRELALGLFEAYSKMEVWACFLSVSVHIFVFIQNHLQIVLVTPVHLFFLIRNSFIRNLLVAHQNFKKLILVTLLHIRNHFIF